MRANVRTALHLFHRSRRVAWHQIDVHCCEAAKTDCYFICADINCCWLNISPDAQIPKKKKSIQAAEEQREMQRMAPAAIELNSNKLSSHHKFQDQHFQLGEPKHTLSALSWLNSLLDEETIAHSFVRMEYLPDRVES